MLKMNEIKDLDVQNLDAKIAECRKELQAITLNRMTAGVEKPHRINVLKKNIARLLTVRNAKR